MKARIVVIAAAGVAVVGLAIYSRPRHAAPAPSPGDTESVSMKRKAKPRMPAPRMPVAAPPADSLADESPATNLITRLEKGQLPGVTVEQLEPYLRENQRSADSLLGAFRAIGDRALLREALEKYPNDPRLAFAAYYLAGPYNNNESASAERRRWLDAVKQSAPDNALGSYLSARDYFKSGQTEQAVQELVAAASRPKLQDYSLEFVQNAEEAYRAAGYSEAEAKAVASASLPIPQLSELKQLGLNLVALANSYRQAGDEASAQATLQMGLTLSQRLESGQGLLLQELAGLAIERQILGLMDASSPHGSAGQTVQDRLDESTRRRESLKALGQQVATLLRTMSEQDLISYYDRLKVFGDEAALRWAVSRQGKP